MSKINEFYLAKGEEGQKRLDTWQIEADHYGDSMSPEEIEQTLKEDEGYQKFLDEIEGTPF